MKLDVEIKRKSANFDLKNPQNISVDQITFSFYYELVMNFLLKPKESHNIYELYLALWNRTLVNYYDKEKYTERDFRKALICYHPNGYFSRNRSD